MECDNWRLFRDKLTPCVIDFHYENMPVQYIYRFFFFFEGGVKKSKISLEFFYIYLTFAPKHRLWVLVRTASPT